MYRSKWIDELRGLAVIIMVCFHFLYQEYLWTGYMGELLENIYVISLKTISQIIFIFLAGVCCNYSRDNIKRGLVYIYIGLLINFCTYILIPKEKITFGIFSFMGVSVLIYELVKNKLSSIPIKKGIVIFLLLFIIFYTIQTRTVLSELKCNVLLKNVIQGGYLNFMGLKSTSFRSSDFFPLMPWIFIFFAGVLLGSNTYYKESSRKIKLSFLSSVGRKSLFIYIIHIPILVIIIKIIN